MPGDKMFVDEDFPSNAASVGEIELLDRGDFNLSKLRWYRIQEVLGCDWDTKPQLFEDRISSSDIEQGLLDNCWLLSGLACIAQRFPELIESRFTSPRDPETGRPTISAKGRYIIQLWDLRKKTWVDIIIDDMIPCLPVADGNAQPLFARTTGNAAWVLLMEKAFAKYFGCYASLEVGFVDIVFKMIGGDKVDDHLEYWEPKGVEPWQPVRSVIRVKSKAEGRTVLQTTTKKTKGATRAISTVEMFEKLRSWIKSPDYDFIIGARSKDEDESQAVLAANGMVWCHAYAVLDIAVMQGYSMLKLANPHGKGSKEWKGAWSNTDTKLWKDHPEVAQACGWDSSMAGTGTFWMQDYDFDRYFDTLYVARLPKNPDGAALAKLSGAAGVTKVAEALQSGEWETESEDEDSDDDDDEEEEEEEQGEEEEEKQRNKEADGAKSGPAINEQFYRRVFDYYADMRGTITRDQLFIVLTSVTGVEVPRRLVNQLLAAVGLAFDKEVSFKNLIRMVKLVPHVSTFMQYDTDKSGCLSRDEVKLIATRLVDGRIANRTKTSRVTAVMLGCVTGQRNQDVEEQVDAIIREFDKDDDHTIDFQEFIQLFDKLLKACD